VIYKILGKEDSRQVDKAVLGFFTVMMKPEVILDIPAFWLDTINTQFMTLSLTSSFKFPLVVTYLFLYQNTEHFTSLGLNIVVINKKK